MSSEKTISLKLLVWRQKGKDQPGAFVAYDMKDVSTDMSFLEMLDVLNDQLTHKGEAPIEFESDCREGICGSCGLFINGQAHGPLQAVATCQLHMRSFRDGQTIAIEPWRARAFPVTKDLCTDRSSLDRIQAAGGYTSAKTGPHPDANTQLIPKDIADAAMDAATCIQCGACVAACPNASASLFTAARISQFALLPQGHPERQRRVVRMVKQMDLEGFGNCTNIGECRTACPKEISIDNIARMRREYARALVTGTGGAARTGGDG